MLRHLFFLMIALGCGLGLDFYSKSTKAGGTYGILDYAGQAGLDFADASEAVQKFLNPPKLRKALPAKLEGWEVHPFGVDDLKIVLGREPTPEERKSFNEMQVMKSVAMSATDGLTMLERAYYRDDFSVAVTATHVTSGGLRGNAMKMGLNQIGGMLMEDKQPLITVDGIAFFEDAKRDRGNHGARLIHATVTDAISINLVTHSTDNAALAELVAAINFQMLNELLAEPHEAIVEADPVILAATDAVDPPASTEIAAPEETNAAAANTDLAEASTDATNSGQVVVDRTQKSAPLDPVARICIRKAGVVTCTKG